MIILAKIPMPPSLNNAYPTGRNGRRYKSEKYRAWERDFTIWGFENSKQLAHARAVFSKARPGYVVWIHSAFYFKRESILTRDDRPKKNDTSNRIKILHDGISKAIWLDDSYFWDGSFVKRVTRGAENCAVALEWRFAPGMIPE